VTPQRQLILDAVCALGGHVTPEEVYTHVSAVTPTLNQATVYRTLHFLSEQGVIRRPEKNGGKLGNVGEQFAPDCMNLPKRP